MTKISFKNKTIIVLIIIIILLMVFFIIKPAIIGYSIYDKVQKSNYSLDTFSSTISSLKTKLKLAQNNITAVKQFTSQLISINSNCSEKYAACVNSNIKNEYICNSTINGYKSIINKLKSKLNITIAEIDNYKSNYSQSIADEKTHYSQLARNSADNICCKEKVDNPNINYYIVQNDRIVCLEKPGLPLSCTG